MNKQRRKALATVQELISECGSRLQELQEQEQFYLDAMPESFQNADKGQASQEALDNMQEALDALESVDSAIEASKGS